MKFGHLVQKLKWVGVGGAQTGYVIKFARKQSGIVGIESGLSTYGFVTWKFTYTVGLNLPHLVAQHCKFTISLGVSKSSDNSPHIPPIHRNVTRKKR